MTKLGGCCVVVESLADTSDGKGLKETVSGGKSTMFVSCESKLNGPRRSLRLRNALLSGTITGTAMIAEGSSSSLFKKQHPPPQQTFSISLVSARGLGESIRRTSSGLCEISTVEARLFLGAVGGTVNVPSVFLVSSIAASSTCGSVTGVPADSLSEPDVYSGDAVEELGDGCALTAFLG